LLARQLVQTLRHSDPGDIPVWSRQNGNLTLTIQQGYDKTVVLENWIAAKSASNLIG
jgi:hypothetical protein